MIESRTSASVLTIARGRDAHLRNLVRGLTHQSHPPRELVIGVMQDDAYAGLPETDFPIRQILVRSEELPLARARNAVAEAATGDVLVFLDVDCIPDPALVADYVAQTKAGDGLTMGEILYLPAGATEPGWTYETFAKVGVRHSDRQGPPAEARRPCNDYRCFWSLSFAMHRTDWARAGGFDERFVGYGGEDTDFGRTLDALGIPIWWLRGARAYHQYHPHCMPPIHHIPSILRNAELFATKWGHRTMEHWLHGFRMMGLIENTPDGLRILREPGPEEFALCSQLEDRPYAATAPVIRALEARERQGLQGPAVIDPAENRNDPARHAAMTRAQAEMLYPPAATAAK